MAGTDSPDDQERRREDPGDRSNTATAAGYTISDRESFDAVTAADHAIAGIYAWAELDKLIDLARLVSLDFFERPEYYKEFQDPNLVEKIAQLHARYGCEERFLSNEQRKAIFTPLFRDAAGDFARDRDALLSAAATFAEWGQSTGEPMLREAVKTTHENFLGQLTLFTGASITWSRQESFPFLTNEICYPILRERGVTAAFGVSVPPGRHWPFREDSNGDQLVEEIGRRLDPDGLPLLTRHGFRLQQRAALRGAEAIAAALDFNAKGDDEALNQLITRCYTWYAALQGTTGMGRVNATSPMASVNGDRREAGAGSFLPR